MSEDIKQIIEQYGIVDEEGIVTARDLEKREEVNVWEILLFPLSWNTDGS